MTDEGFSVGNYLDGQKMKSWWRFLRRVKGYWCLYLLAARIAIVGWMAKFDSAWDTKIAGWWFFVSQAIERSDFFGGGVGKWFTKIML